MVDTLAGLNGAIGVVAALLARERDGRGQVVRAPLLDAAASVVELLMGLGDRAPSAWVGLQWACSPFVGPYRCEDGRWVFVHFGLARHVDRLLELLDDEGMIRVSTELRHVMSAATREDPGAVASPGEAAAIRDVLRALFDSRPAEAWEALMGRGGLCCVVARTGAEWRRSATAVEAGHVIEVGGERQPGPWSGADRRHRDWHVRASRAGDSASVARLNPTPDPLWLGFAFWTSRR